MSDRTPEALREAVLAAEDRRHAAMTARDVEALAELLDDELVYVHSGGFVETKQGYLTTLGSGYVEYGEIAHPVETLIAIGDVVIVHGTMSATARVGGEPRELSNITVAVWRCDGSSPRLVTLQATPLPQS